MSMKKISRASVAKMTDEEVFSLSMAHPENPNQRAFSFTLRDFESRAEMAACMAALVLRMQKINNQFGLNRGSA